MLDYPHYLAMDSLGFRLLRNGTTVDRAQEITERAAIIEYDGKVARDEAEDMAITGVAHGA